MNWKPKKQAGKSAFGDADAEKKRITWEGIAVWTNLGLTFKGLKNLGVVMTGSAYPDLWNLTYTPGDLADPKNFSAAQYETRVQALSEMMNAQ